MVLNMGGRPVSAFVSHEKNGDLVSVQPVPEDGMHGLHFSADSDEEWEIDIFGVKSDRGERVSELYASGEYPADEVSWDDIYPEDE